MPMLRYITVKSAKEELEKLQDNDVILFNMISGADIRFVLGKIYVSKPRGACELKAKTDKDLIVTLAQWREKGLSLSHSLWIMGKNMDGHMDVDERTPVYNNIDDDE